MIHALKGQTYREVRTENHGTQKMSDESAWLPKVVSASSPNNWLEISIYPYHRPFLECLMHFIQMMLTGK